MYLHKINYKLLILLLSSIIISACGGGGSSSGGGDKTTAPNLSDASSQTYELYKTIDTLTFANSGGNITSCTTSPDLPTGLQLSNSCTVSGTPTTETNKTKYVITGSNTKGTDTAEIYIATKQNKPALTNMSKAFGLKANVGNFVLKSNAGVKLISCNDIGNPTLDSIGLAVNVSEDKTSCVVSGTLKDGASGTGAYTISATNNKGTSSNTILTIRISDDLVGNPNLTTPDNQTYIKDTSIVPLVLPNKEGAILTSCTATGLPSGLSVTVSSDACQLTGVPTVIQTGTSVTITASNGSGTDSNATFNITVNPLTFTLENTANVDIAEGTVYTSATPIVDGNTPIGDLTYSISGTDANLFTVNSNTGVVNMVARDFEIPADSNADNVYNYTLKAVDIMSNEATLNMLITITNVNDNNPIFSSGNSISVAENLTITGYTAIATDADDDMIAYSLTGGDDKDKFSIVAGTGALSFVSPPDYEKPLDHDTNNAYQVTISATDTINTTTQDVVVTVTNTNDNNPIFSSGNSISVAENLTITGYTAIATDADDGDMIAYSLTGGDDKDKFSIVAGTGALSFVSPPDYEKPLDHDTNNAYQVTISATDTINTTTQDVVVTVTNTNDNNPIFSSGNSISVAENLTITGYTAIATDADDDMIAYSLTGGDDKDKFSIVAGTGALSFVSPPDYEKPLDHDTNNAYQVTISATDTINTTTQDVVVTVTNTNDNNPIFSSGNSISVAENLTITGYTAIATDADDGDMIAYSLTGGDDKDKFSIVAGTGALSFVSPPDYEKPLDHDTNNAYQVTISATDTINTTTQDVVVTVTNTNDNNPIFSSGNSISVAENLTITGYTAIATDADDDMIAYSLTGGDDKDKFSIVAGTGALSFVSPPDYEKPLDHDTNNAYQVTISATDTINTTTQDVVVTVTNTDDNDLIFSSGNSISVAENLTITGYTAIAADADTDDIITYSLTGGDDKDKFSIVSGTGVLSFKSPPDYEKPLDHDTNNAYQVTISATDTINTTTQDVVVTVTDVSPIINDQTISSKQGIIFKGELDTVTNLTGYTFVIKTESSKGTVAILTDTDKEFTYEYTAEDNSTSDSFIVTANCAGESKDATITINIALNDPLYQFQWHLHNTGQTAFARVPGTAGSDLNMQQTIKNGYTGSGVKVSVVDTGLEIAHEDLVDNIEPNKSCDFSEEYSPNCEDQDPTSTGVITGDHGTSVAGLIAATGWNNKGGRGVAPSAKLRGFNVLEDNGNDGRQYIGYYVTALGGSNLSSDVDIFNQSYGVSVVAVTPANEFVNLNYWNGVENLRNGKGAIYIKSAGNGFLSGVNCDDAHNAKVSCQNANMDSNNAQPYNIVIGAINANDKISSYSTHGSNIWISTYGGENGINILYHGVTNKAGGVMLYRASSPAMVTTDQSGCDKGYTTVVTDLSGYTGGTKTDKTTPFHDTREGQLGATHNPSCNYTSTFNGTSSAAPVTSGVVALLLEANSNLTWRDVKHILAKTATQIDTDASPVIYTTGAGDYTAADGWITNGAGFKFHNAYGFGKINVDAAISMATNNYQTLNPFIKGAWHSKINLDKAIPDNSAAGVSDTQNINENLVIESVQVEVDITHTFTGDLGIELTSPSGTKSILFNIKNIFGNTDNLGGMLLLSNAFYGESSQGNWTLKVIDAGANGNDGNDTGTGKLNSWKVKIYGHNN